MPLAMAPAVTAHGVDHALDPEGTTLTTPPRGSPCPGPLRPSRRPPAIGGTPNSTRKPSTLR
eukprot:6768049-Lingulodinium_polyedra.AAC.1